MAHEIKIRVTSDLKKPPCIIAMAGELRPWLANSGDAVNAKQPVKVEHERSRLNGVRLLLSAEVQVFFRHRSPLAPDLPMIDDSSSSARNRLEGTLDGHKLAFSA
ncbi:hypothetical protein IVB56_19850 [Bradyrhizobium sp. CW7]|uniref:hypothetical protein n=1 Tax=Bradyrhizobium sp. CW7 TaxID=2782688 RepID=UPI001FF83FE1|nr:hypothetical protein [Bradyrhizobium sp. CW7]MCK1353283.1 hypothetical protein [Bradyrhizobium sp. CW7]